MFSDSSGDTDSLSGTFHEDDEEIDDEEPLCSKAELRNKIQTLYDDCVGNLRPFITDDVFGGDAPISYYKKAMQVLDVSPFQGDEEAFHHRLGKGEDKWWDLILRKGVVLKRIRELMDELKRVENANRGTFTETERAENMDNLSRCQIAVTMFSGFLTMCQNIQHLYTHNSTVHIEQIKAGYLCWGTK